MPRRLFKNHIDGVVTFKQLMPQCRCVEFFPFMFKFPFVFFFSLFNGFSILNY